jgi:putative metalloprotease
VEIVASLLSPYFNFQTFVVFVRYYFRVLVMEFIRANQMTLQLKNPNHIDVMKNKIIIASFVIALPLQAMAFDLGGLVKNSGSDLIKAGTLSEKDVISQSRAAVKSMDSSSKGDSAAAKYSDRLNKIVSRVDLPKIEGVEFNFKVYKSAPDDLNAFATPDGSIRFHSALMDAMTDNQILAVVGHEIGHVVKKHSFKQMRKALLTSAAMRGAASQSEVGSVAYNNAGGLADKFLNATFSRGDELGADGYALTVLQQADAPLESMSGAIGVLQAKYGDGGGMLSSHPSSPKRIKSLAKKVKKMSK